MPAETIEMVVIPKSELIALIRQELNCIFPPVLTGKTDADITDISGIVELTGWAAQTIYEKHSKKVFPPGCVWKSGKKLFFSKKAIAQFIQSEGN